MLTLPLLADSPQVGQLYRMLRALLWLVLLWLVLGYEVVKRTLLYYRTISVVSDFILITLWYLRPKY